MRADEGRIAELNRKLLAKNQPGDFRSTNEHLHEGDVIPEDPTGADIKAFVKAALSSSSNDVDYIVRALGLDKGHISNKAKKDALAKGIRTLCDVHFGNYTEKEQADILGELLFNSRFFSKQYCDEVTVKTTASVASCVFNSVSLLKCIETRMRAL